MICEGDEAISHAQGFKLGEAMKPRISLITLGARDLAKATNFYEHGLELPRMKCEGDVSFFTLDLFRNSLLLGNLKEAKEAQNRRVSRPTDLPGWPLAKRCVNLSIHTASIRQYQCFYLLPSVQTLLVLWL